MLLALSIPPPLTVLGSIALMIAGLYVMYSALRKPPRGSPAEISLLPGLKLTVKGPAWLVMLALGAAMVAAPLLAAATQVPDTTFQPAAPAKVVSKIPEPDYQHFRFSKDISYLDLRTTVVRPWYTLLPGWTSIAPRHSRIRPATLVNTMAVRKVDPVDFLHIFYSTSGDLDLRCLTHPYSLQTSLEDDQRVAEVIADVRQVPVGVTFDVVNEVTYWNAFSGQHGDFYSTYTHDQGPEPEAVDVFLIFPDSKPFTAMTILERPPGSDQDRLSEQQTHSHVGAKEMTYYWSTIASGGKWFFTLKWAW